MKKFKVIVDTDPGVDDTTGLVYILHDPQFDIKLFTTSNGNIDISKCTRNMCHLLDLFHKDYPVVEGYRKRLGNNTEDASFLHTKEGLGGWKPPKQTKHKPLNKDCADAMYEVLKANPHEVTLIVLGPHTNVAYLLRKHPDAKDLIKQILMMGGAPMGIQANPNHNSFNIRTDAPAFKEVIDSKIPTIMVPSSIGRDRGHFTEAQVEQVSKANDVGAFLAKTYGTYWEPNYPDRRISTNDISAIYYLTHPSLYKIKRADIDLDVKTGKTTAVFKKNGVFRIAMDLKRSKFQKLLFDKLKAMDNIKLPELEKQNKNIKVPSWATTHSTPRKKASTKKPIKSMKRAVRVAKKATTTKNNAPKTIKQAEKLAKTQNITKEEG